MKQVLEDKDDDGAGEQVAWKSELVHGTAKWGPAPGNAPPAAVADDRRGSLCSPR